jgi:hypothetical protein
MTPNTFPAPEGTAHVSFTGLKAGQTTPNFTWAEQGLYTISLELADLNNSSDQVQLQSVVSGTSTAIITMLESGYFDFVVPAGGGTYNFTTVNDVRNVRVTQRYKRSGSA